MVYDSAIPVLRSQRNIDKRNGRLGSNHLAQRELGRHDNGHLHSGRSNVCQVQYRIVAGRERLVTWPGRCREWKWNGPPRFSEERSRRFAQRSTISRSRKAHSAYFRLGDYTVTRAPRRDSQNGNDVCESRESAQAFRTAKRMRFDELLVFDR